MLVIMVRFSRDFTVHSYICHGILDNERFVIKVRGVCFQHNTAFPSFFCHALNRDLHSFNDRKQNGTPFLKQTLSVKAMPFHRTVAMLLIEVYTVFMTENRAV